MSIETEVKSKTMDITTKGYEIEYQNKMCHCQKWYLECL